MDQIAEEIKAEAAVVEDSIQKLLDKSESSSMIVPVIVTILLILFGAFLMRRNSLFTSNKRCFIICGIQGSGKTNLYHLLTKGELPKLTVTSFEPSTGDLRLSDDYMEKKTFQDIQIIDFPANEKLKNLYLFPFFKERIHELRGIIYMIDSSNFDAATCHKVAKDILEILNITEARPNGIDMLIFANKNDLFTSMKSTKIKELLEAEIGKIHELNARGISKVSNSVLNGAGDEDDKDDNADNLDLAIKNGKFQFQLLESNVDFGEGNIFKNKWDQINDWLLEKIVN
ncbi:hypothetical protein CANINC_003821 [Pichia inconspicua]|uniref:Signal recognition particle receptor subunit beta n=1 Tax=Pichia inconspicua TaxID=52247 RepID=A0A4T0WXV8_9ASCO|nr:hypothetical protein CANINC_003821 [[Candida] inconspicua]